MQFRFKLSVAVLLVAFTFATNCAVAQEADYKSLEKESNKLYKAGKYKRSLALTLQVLKLLEKKFGTEHEKVSIHLYGLGYLYDKMDRLEKAADAFRRSVLIREKIYGKNHMGTASALERLAHILKKQGKLKGAERAYARVKSIKSQRISSNHSFVASDHGNLASIALQRRAMAQGPQWLSANGPPCDKAQTQYRDG